jgi:HSP20 family protein
MTYFIAPTPYRMARRWARMAECEQPDSSRRYTLSVDVREQDDAYVLSVQVLEDVVTIEGEFKGDENEYLMRELPHGAFRRSLRLPVALDAEKAQARISDGVLSLTLPKAESARPKTVKIAVK